jgi:antitoxin ParD1/3/4
MTITLPDEYRSTVEAKARAAGFVSVHEYVLQLILDEEEGDVPDALPVPEELIVKDRADLEAKILEGLNSGPPIRVTPQFWEDFRQRVEERAAARRARGV